MLQGGRLVGVWLGLRLGKGHRAVSLKNVVFGLGLVVKGFIGNLALVFLALGSD